MRRTRRYISSRHVQKSSVGWPRNSARPAIARWNACEWTLHMPGTNGPLACTAPAGAPAREFEMRLGGATYEEIARQGGGIAATVRATRAATNAQLRAAAARRLQAAMAEGVTTIEIKSGYGLDVENELRILRVAQSLAAEGAISVVTTLLGAHAIPAEYAGRGDDYVRLVCDEMIPRAGAERLATAVDGFCERIAFSAEQ